MKLFDLLIDIRKSRNLVRRMANIVYDRCPQEMKADRISLCLIEMRELEAKWPDSYLMRAWMAFLDIGSIEESMSVYEDSVNP